MAREEGHGHGEGGASGRDPQDGREDRDLGEGQGVEQTGVPGGLVDLAGVEAQGVDRGVAAEHDQDGLGQDVLVAEDRLDDGAGRRGQAEPGGDGEGGDGGDGPQVVLAQRLAVVLQP